MIHLNKKKEKENEHVVTSTIVIPVTEFRTKWQRVWPNDEKNMKTVTSQESFVRSRVQRYSVGDSEQISKQIGYVNTVNTARVYSDGEQTWCWVVHNKLAPETTQVYTSTCFIQPTANTKR
ncbi:unnamed protein product [Caenorhabditis sp. 36 PRJEB53466]|nr:unnamed protein product [Caenorhabditis sp. 36 PRJEB53466]